MKAKDFERALARWTPWGATALDQRSRRYRAANLLRTAGFGPAAPEINATEAATILIGLVANTATDAADVVVRYATMVQPGGGATFGEWLSGFLNDPVPYARNDPVDRLVINRAWAEATVWFRDGRSVEFRPEDWKAEERPPYFGWNELVLTGTLLEQLGIELVETPGGWVSG